MVFVACGLNHKTTPLALREQVAIAPTVQASALDSLLSLKTVDEAVILSTCNRTEIYCETETPATLMPWLADTYLIPKEALTPHFYLYPEEQGMRHLMRVASGLDSMMLGEPQVLGQLKLAYQTACISGAIQSKLRPIFEYTFSATKRIRNLSGIAKNPVSIASACVQLVMQHCKKLEETRIFLIGSGETAALVAKYLQKAGASHFVVASRCLDNAQQLAAQFQGKPVALSAIPQYLVQSDVVISATTCPLPFIDKPMVEEVLRQRSHKSLFLLDLAVPRDIDVAVGTLDGVILHNIDALQNLIDKGLKKRQMAAEEAEALVHEELARYARWYRSLKAKDLVFAYREQMQRLGQEELQKAFAKLAAGMDQETVLSTLCQKLINKLTHTPTIGLKKMALDNRIDLLDFSRYLFNPLTQENKHEEIA